MKELKVKDPETLKPEHYIVNKYGSKQKIELDGDFATWFIGFAIKGEGDTSFHESLVAPVFDGAAHNNLYGRMMTIVEAIIEDKDRQKAVKDLVGKEISDFGKELHRSAAEIANYGNSSDNIYTR